MSARFCFPHHRQALHSLACFEAEGARPADTPAGPLPLFATRCLEALTEPDVDLGADFTRVLRRITERSRALTPGKPAWLVEGQVVLHICERLLGQSTLAAPSPEHASAIRVHRARRRSYGTYSTPDHVADRMCGIVLAELRKRGAPDDTIRIADLSAEAGHFALATLGCAPRQRVKFTAFERDPEAIGLLEAILNRASHAAADPRFQLRAVLADSILDQDPASAVGTMDAIIGNPPWKTMHATDERRYASRFGDILRGRFDVYQAFMLRADELVRPGGVIGMVVPGAFLCTDNARDVRRHLLDRYEMVDIATYPRRTFVELPGVAPIAIVLRKKVASRVAPRLKVSVFQGLAENQQPTHTFTIDTRREWAREGRAAFPVARLGPSRFNLPRRIKPVSLGALGSFSSGAKLSGASRVPAAHAFTAVAGRAICPFVIDRRACTDIEEGAASFARLPRTDMLDRPRLIFQTLRCVSMPRRLIAAAAGPGELPCSTAAMFVAESPALVDFLAGLFNSAFLNGWYKARDHHHTIKMSVLAELHIPEDRDLWEAIGQCARDIAEGQRTLHEHAADCGALCSKYRDAAGESDKSLFEIVRRLDDLVFDLYHAKAEERADLAAFSAIDRF